MAFFRFGSLNIQSKGIPKNKATVHTLKKKCFQRKNGNIEKPLNILEWKKLYTYISGKENTIMENV